MTDDRAEQAFRDAFAQQADRLAPGPLPVVRRRRRWPALVAAAAVVVLVGGGMVLDSQPPDPTPDEGPIAVDTGTVVPLTPGMTVTPVLAAPGQVVSVTYRKDWTRGVGYQLARPDRLDAPDYVMGASNQSVYWSSTDDEYGFDDLGVTGTGPDRVQVPDDIDAGEWVLCTANARPQKCTSLTVPAGAIVPPPLTDDPDEPGSPVRVWLDPAGQFLTVETTGSSSCPSLVAEVRVLDDDMLMVRTMALAQVPGQPCTADQRPHRDTWPLVGDQAQHASYAAVTTSETDTGVRTQIMIGPPGVE